MPSDKKFKCFEGVIPFKGHRAGVFRISPVLNPLDISYAFLTLAGDI